MIPKIHITFWMKLTNKEVQNVKQRAKERKRDGWGGWRGEVGDCGCRGTTSVTITACLCVPVWARQSEGVWVGGVFACKSDEITSLHNTAGAAMQTVMLPDLSDILSVTVFLRNSPSLRYTVKQDVCYEDVQHSPTISCLLFRKSFKGPLECQGVGFARIFSPKANC